MLVPALRSRNGSRSVSVLEVPVQRPDRLFGYYRYRIRLGDRVAGLFRASDLGLVSSRVHMAEFVPRRSCRAAPVLDITGSGVGLLPPSRK